jgi:hypothetical protein
MFTSEYYYDGRVCGLDDNVFKFTYTLSLWHPRGRKMNGKKCHIGITALYEYYLPPNVVIKRKLKIPHCQNSYTIWSMSEQLHYLINVRTVTISDQYIVETEAKENDTSNTSMIAHSSDLLQLFQ